MERPASLICRGFFLVSVILALDLAATLNEYRERALGGGDVTDEPQAAEPA